VSAKGDEKAMITGKQIYERILSDRIQPGEELAA
jgi:hypothetical protein